MTPPPPPSSPADSTPSLGSATGELLDLLASVADAARAAGEQAYLKSGRDFLGVGVPATRRIVRALVRDLGVDSHDELAALALEWWDGPYFECRRSAVEVLAARVDWLDDGDLPLIESLVRDGETWAVVDPLAVDVAGRIVRRLVDERGGLPDEVGATLDRWSADPDSFWVRRASMLCLLPTLKASTPGEEPDEWPRFCRYAESMLAEREFFIRKAIGWVLREVSKTQPDLVREWVEPRLGAMSGVTRREALKYL